VTETSCSAICYFWDFSLDLSRFTGLSLLHFRVTVMNNYCFESLCVCSKSCCVAALFRDISCKQLVSLLFIVEIMWLRPSLNLFIHNYIILNWEWEGQKCSVRFGEALRATTVVAVLRRSVVEIPGSRVINRSIEWLRETTWIMNYEVLNYEMINLCCIW